MKKLLFIMPIVFLLSCQSDEVSLQGHWHNLTDTENDRYTTIDFIDSIIIVDKSNISFKCEGIYHLSCDTIYFSICGQPDCFVFEFKVDTLILNNEKWIKIKNERNDSLIDFFATLKLNVKLEKKENTIPFHAINNFNGNISFGKCKKSDPKNQNQLDTFSIQVNHSIGNFNAITAFLDASKEASEDERSIMLTIDENTPNWMVDSTISMIRKHKIIDKIYITCIDKQTGALGLVELKE